MKEIPTKVYDVIENVTELPSSPKILPKLLNVLNNPESTNWAMAEIISVDPALTTQLLRWSNSSFYGCSDKCIDIEAAINRIGTAEIYRLVGMSVSKQLASKPLEKYGLHAKEFWEESILTAIIMEVLAKKMSRDANAGYTTGLLNGIGKVVINNCPAIHYEQIFETIDKENLNLVDSENKVLGFNHAEAGGALLDRWDFQEDIYEAVLHQYNPLEAPKHKRAACMLNISKHLVSEMGYAPKNEHMKYKLDPSALRHLLLSQEDIEPLIEESQKRFDELKEQLMQV